MEVDHGTADRDAEHEQRDEELHERGRRQHALGAVGLAQDVFILGDVPVDDLGALDQTRHLALDQGEQLDRAPPVRHHPLEVLVARPGRGPEVGAGLILGLDQRVVHRLEDLADHRVALRRVDLGDRLDRVDPAGRRRRHLLGRLVVLLEVSCLFGQPAIEGRAFGEVPAHGGVDPLELALDDPLLGLAPRGQQNLAVAGLQPLFGEQHGTCGQAHGPVQGAGQRQDRPVRRQPGEIHGHRQDQKPEQPGGRRVQEVQIRKWHDSLASLLAAPRVPRGAG